MAASSSAGNSHPAPLVWLDCDPGHDDAFAIMLAAWAPGKNQPEGDDDRAVELIGLSATHGNQEVHKTAANILRTLDLCGFEGEIEVGVGQARPLVRESLVCPEIHGHSGLDVASKQDDAAAAESAPDAMATSFSVPVTRQLNAEKGVLLMFRKITEAHRERGRRVTLVATGCLTNVALLLTLFPEVEDSIQQLIILGGSEGIGNISPAAEFNILVDPEGSRLLLCRIYIVAAFRFLSLGGSFLTPRTTRTAARIVFDRGEHGLSIVQIPIEVTHTALVTPEVLAKIRAMDSSFSKVCVDLLTFFGDTYDRVFGFKNGPPLHDPLAILYAFAPELFETVRVRVDVEISSGFCDGRTVVDVFGHSKKAPNVTLAKRVDVPEFWNWMMKALERADGHSPLNR
jgi:inosine-uridine nucleoside N-ribohydrolase